MTNLGEQQERIKNFRSQSETSYIFACQAAVPLVFNADLLYQLWNNFKQYQYVFDTESFYKIPHIAVSDLLLSNLCREVGFELYEMEKEVRDLLLADLASRLGEKRRNTIAAFLQDYAQVEHRYGQRKKLKNVHLLTAQSILDPSGMEKSMIDYINDTKSDAEKLNYLMLHKQLLPVGFDSELGKISSGIKGKSITPILIAEDNPNATGVMTVKLPGVLRGRIRRVSRKDNVVATKGNVESVAQIIKECIKSGSTHLDLGNQALKDEDFIEGSTLDNLLRQCHHIQLLILSNGTDHAPTNQNYFNRIPPVVSSLTGLRIFHCSGELNNRWGIQDLSPLRNLVNLEHLALSYNQISSMEVLSQLVRLESLSLSHNNISTLIAFDIFPRLWGLNIKDNKITDFRPLLPLLQRASNPLRIILKNRSAHQMQEILVHGNPLDELLTKAILAGDEAVINYLNEGGKRTPDYIDPSEVKKVAELRKFVGQIDAGGTKATCFIMKGNLLHPSFGEEMLCVTPSHVFFRNGNEKSSFDLSGVSIIFSDLDSLHCGITEIVWYSSISKLNTALLRFNASTQEKLQLLMENIKPYTIATKVFGDSLTMFTSFGISIFTFKAEVTGIQDIFVEYNAKTPAGSSGSPLFNGDGEMVAMHHLGSTMQDGAGSNRGVLMTAVVNELKNHFDKNVKQSAANIIKVFLSASPELTDDLIIVQRYINEQLALRWKEKGIILQPVWPKKSPEGESDYHAVQDECEIVLHLVHKAPGFSTPSEVRNALYSVNRKDKPFIFVFAKADVPNFGDSNSNWLHFMRMAKKQEFWIADYRYVDDLCVSLSWQFEKIYTISADKQRRWTVYWTSIAIQTSILHQQAKEWEQAENVLVNMMYSDPNNAIDVRLELSRVYQQQKRLGEAEKILEDVIHKHAPYVRIYIELSKVYALQQKWDEAEQILQSQLESKQMSESIGLQLARIYQQQAKFPQAVEELEGIVDRNPSNTEALLELSGAYRMLFRMDEAERLLKSVLELADGIDARLELSALYEQQKRWQEAENVLLEASKSNSSDQNLILSALESLRARVTKLLTVNTGDTIKVHYHGRLDDGTTFDSSEGKEPLEFEVGAGTVIKGFDEGVLGMKVGEKKTIQIPVEDAYGPSNEENIIEFPKSQFPADMTPEVGMQLNLKSQDDQQIPVVITEIKEETVTLDANHPLAGKDLIFDIELVEIVNPLEDKSLPS